MTKLVSVVIPFYQREIGILSNALASLEKQTVPAGWHLEVIVVDDGSPVSGRSEIEAGNFSARIDVHLIEKENGGVASARNAGLQRTFSRSDAVAFLDSDDTWPETFLERAIAVWEAGYDFYFTDNVRTSEHPSNIQLCAKTANYLLAAQSVDGIVDISADKMTAFCIEEFPCQLSTVFYRSVAAPGILFAEHLTAAGEDLLFVSELLSRMKKVAFDEAHHVICGDGVNIYYGNLNWDSPKFLNIKIDQLLAHRALKRRVSLSSENGKLNSYIHRKLLADVRYHLVRSAIKRPASFKSGLARIARSDALALLSVAIGI